MLKALSPLLELQQAMLTADDLANWPEPIRQLFVDRRVLIPARPATHVSCDACYEGHIEEVNRVGGSSQPRFYISCPEAGWVDVAESRLLQWAIDVDRLASLLADAVSSGQADVLMRGVAWELGALNIGDDSFDVVFFRPGQQPVGDAWSQLSTRMVLARTVVISPGDIRERPDDLAAAFTLDAAFELAESGIAFQARRVQTAITTGSKDVGNVFQLRGDFWQVTFAGATAYLKDSVGMGYMARLLAEPNRDIPAVALLAARAGIDPLVATGSLGPTMDEQTFASCAERYRTLRDDLEEAHENLDQGRIHQLESEREQLTEILAKATGMRGTPREKYDADRVRKAVSMAVSRDIDKISEKHPALGQHLISAISSGLTFRYTTEGHMDWLT